MTGSIDRVEVITSVPAAALVGGREGMDHSANLCAWNVGVASSDLPFASTGIGAEREIGLPGYPDFANEHDIERRVRCPDNVNADGDTAARQCQDHVHPG